MKKVLDQNNQPIKGLLRDEKGALIVDDQKELAKYKNQLNRERELNDLREQVSSLSSLVHEFKKMMENNNG
jgi:hypothetical protein